MKLRSNRKFALTLTVIGIASLAAGCGKSGDSSNLGGGLGGGGGIAGGCLPINGQIPFTGTNNTFSWLTIRAGTNPQTGQSFGQLTTGSTTGGITQGGPYTRNGVNGSISMNITPAGGYGGGIYPQYGQSGYGIPSGYPSGYPTNPSAPSGYAQPNGYNPYFGQVPSAANINGVLQLSPAVQQDIYYVAGSLLGINNGYTGGGSYSPNPYGGYMPMPYYPGQQGPNSGNQICVSGIALDLNHYYNIVYSQPYVTSMFLYLNGTQHGYKMSF